MTVTSPKKGNRESPEWALKTYCSASQYVMLIAQVREFLVHNDLDTCLAEDTSSDYSNDGHLLRKLPTPCVRYTRA